ncbi:MAG: GNAT family N-acetyltransferase [Verrucomicrobia subdivision 3 bacterium]|nr:GNAT family N-acetyltransferase [Limisphaerales bacterium]
MSQPIIAETDAQIAACFSTMAELRPHLSQAAFLERVKRQMTQGYRLVYLVFEGECVACAGFRILENLAWGKFLYVDDLVTRETSRGRGFGSNLLNWLLDLAQREGCAELHLDSGTQRTGAHRFYFKSGMLVKSFHFSAALTGRRN